MQQRIKVLLVSEKNKAGLETDDLIQRLEIKADTFSQNTLIPKTDYDELVRMNQNGFTVEKIKEITSNINILPDIVVGRLQQYNFLNYQTTLNSLKIKYMIG